MSLNSYATMKSMVATPKFDQRLAAVNGVFVASRIPPGGQMLRKTLPKGAEKMKFTCAICAGPCRDLRELRHHFIACVDRNGNPNAACRDNTLTSYNITSMRERAAASIMPSADYEERRRSLNERLFDIDGVVIPSRLPAGKSPSRVTNYRSSDRHVHPCSVCGRKFIRKFTLRTHFPACVKRNGNPNGARWDSSLDQKCGRTRIERHQSSEYQDAPLGGPHLGNFGFDNVSDTPDLQTIHSDPHDDSGPQPTPEPSFDFNDFLNEQEHYPGLQPSDPQLANPNAYVVQPDNTQLNSSPNDHASHNSKTRMDVQTNGALLSMLEIWQSIVRDGGEDYVLEQPSFHELMAELVERNILSAGWDWDVNVEELDKGFVRVVAEGREV